GMLQLVAPRTLPRGSTLALSPGTDDLLLAINTFTEMQNQPGQPAGYTQHFAWSPDGRAILFDYYKGNAVAIYQANVSGAITLIAQDGWSSIWSPDGECFVAVAAAGLFRAALDGSQRRVLSQRTAKTPAWSADGRHLAFLAPHAPHDGKHAYDDLWVMDSQ